jgi:hypothetical protein
MKYVFMKDINREFGRLQDLAERAMDQVSDEEFFRTIDDENNSMAVIVKHMAGNMRSRWRDYLTTDGEKPDRHRDEEFLIHEQDTQESLTGTWEEGWRILFDAVEPLSDADMGKTVHIRGEPLTVFQALSRQLTHYAYHVGQIVQLAKHFRGAEWSPLSIPKGKSTEFNAKPDRYIGGTDDDE